METNFTAEEYNDGGVTWYLCKRADKKYLVDYYYQTGKGVEVRWVTDAEKATQFPYADLAVEHGISSLDKVNLSSEDKRLVDRYVDELYSLHAFTNEELDDIRQRMVDYASAVLTNDKIMDEQRSLIIERMMGKDNVR